jgi:hypothetical protein
MVGAGLTRAITHRLLDETLGFADFIGTLNGALADLTSKVMGSNCPFFAF